MLLQNIDTVFLQDDERRIEHGIDILVRDGKIVEIGEGLSGESVLDCREKIALPGFINCHTHTPGLISRGWSDDESLFEWLDSTEQIIARADRSEKRAAAQVSAALLAQTGTTTINDMWNTYLAQDLAHVGIRTLLGCGLADFEATDAEAVQQQLDTNREFIEEYRDHPTIHPTVPVHSVYRSTPDLLERGHDIATTADVPFHIHVSETEQENDECRQRFGQTPTGVLADLGVLDQRSVLAHCVHLTESDRTAIAESGAGIAHCPAANLKLGSGIADLTDMDDIAVGLGTDGAGSNNSLNIIREAKTTALVHKRTDPRTPTAQRVLDMMTREAATVLGMADEAGSLEVGKRADIILVDKTDPTLTPAFGDGGLLSNLIYSFHGTVDTAIVDGTVIVEEGTVTADVQQARETVEVFCSQTTTSEQRPP